MSIYTKGQEFNDIAWTTAAPAVVFIDSNLERVRARGVFSMLVTAPELLEEKIPDPQELPALVRNLMAGEVMDVLGDISASVYNVSELAGTCAEVGADLRIKMETPLNSLGLTLTRLEIQAVEAL